jgi:NAD-dependent deacetylase
VHVSIASLSARPSPFWRWVGARIDSFEACSDFTHVAARWIAQPPKAAFVTRLRPGRLPNRAARQLPDQSTTIWMEPSSIGDTRLRGAHQNHCNQPHSRRLPFARDPLEVHTFYNARRRNLIAAKPNAAHFALARLEMVLAERGGQLTLVTQNIDDLHERASSKHVTHMHGELFKARCTACEGVIPWREDLGVCDQSPACGRTRTLRPHVVWFGEMPLELDSIYVALSNADLFVAIGTSGSVYPAAGFVSEARALGIRTCEINLEPSDNSDQFDKKQYGLASEAVHAWVDEILTLSCPD